MPSSLNKLSQFWQELKRRNLVRVITVYAGAAFVIIELINNITEPLHLPEWTPTLVIVLLAIGFPIVIIFSWIYDIHPEGGIVKTEPAEKVKDEDMPKPSNGWKIASYISFAVIVGLIVLNAVPRSDKKEILDKSIAVLPFRNDSPDEEKMYFINGTMEAILDNLCKIKDLRVPGRTSVEQYRDNPKPIPVVAEEMNVSYVLEGSGHRDGNNVRLFVQLLEGKTDKHIWSKSYDADFEEIFSMQSEIAKKIASEIQAAITPEEKVLIEKVPTTSLTAYDFYQKGNEESWKYYMESDNIALEKAEGLFHDALQHDSTYAKAYTGLANVYWMKHYWETIFEEDFLDSALILAEKALSIDDELSEAYTIRGRYYRQIGEIDRAIEDFKRATQFNPNDWMAYTFGGTLYEQIDNTKSIEYHRKALSLNRGEQLPVMLDNLGFAYLANFKQKAIDYFSEAFKLNRDSIYYYYRLGICEYVYENFPAAIEYLKKAYTLDTTNLTILASLGEYTMMNGDYIQSFGYLKKWVERNNSQSQTAIFMMHRLGWAYWQNGLEQEAEEFFKKQIDYCNRLIEVGHEVNNTNRMNHDLAATYAFLGEKEMAIDNLKLYADKIFLHQWGMMYIKNDPLLDPIRDEPDFQQILSEAETKYQAEHERVRQWLVENNLL